MPELNLLYSNNQRNGDRDLLSSRVAASDFYFFYFFNLFQIIVVKHDTLISILTYRNTVQQYNFKINEYIRLFIYRVNILGV